jgi:hypothetical protein
VAKRERERERTVGGVWIFIELSQEASRWTQIQSDNIRSSRTMSGGSEQCPLEALGWELVGFVGICLN